METNEQTPSDTATEKDAGTGMCPGHEFPQLPDRIACTLQQLWNEALDGARETLRDMLREREHAMAARAAALEDSLTLREQLRAANQGAEVLKHSAQERAAEGAHGRSRVGSNRPGVTGRSRSLARASACSVRPLLHNNTT